MNHIFISYNHEDNDFAEILVYRLHDAEFTTWRDVDKLNAGEIWRGEIDQAIKNALAMIVIMTPEAKTSEYVTYEWAFALGVGVKVIPIMLRTTKLHPRLEDIQHLDFTGKFRPWDKLIDTVRRIAELQKYSENHIVQKSPIYVQQAITGLQSLKAAEREEAIQSLAKSDHPAAHEAMIEALEHPLKEIRIQVGLLLAERQEPKAIPILIDTLHTKDDNIRGNVITALTKIGLQAVPHLRNVLDDDNRNARLGAIKVLGQIGNVTATPDLLKMLHDNDEDVRVSAVEALGKIKDNVALPALFEILRDTKSSANLRNAVIWTLVNIGNTDAVPELCNCLLTDEDETIRLSAAAALGWMPNVAALSALQKALHDSDYMVRFGAASTLGKIGDASAIPALQEALHDSDTQVRKYAVDALGEIGDSSAVPALTKALQDTDITIIDKALGALRRIGTLEALAAIEDWQTPKYISGDTQEEPNKYNESM